MFCNITMIALAYNPIDLWLQEIRLLRPTFIQQYNPLTHKPYSV